MCVSLFTPSRVRCVQRRGSRPLGSRQRARGSTPTWWQQQQQQGQQQQQHKTAEEGSGYGDRGSGN